MRLLLYIVVRPCQSAPYQSTTLFPCPPYHASSRHRAGGIQSTAGSSASPLTTAQVTRRTTHPCGRRAGDAISSEFMLAHNGDSWCLSSKAAPQAISPAIVHVTQPAPCAPAAVSAVGYICWCVRLIFDDRTIQLSSQSHAAFRLRFPLARLSTYASVQRGSFHPPALRGGYQLALTAEAVRRAIVMPHVVSL